MDYESLILKTILAPLLDQVPMEALEYIEANRIRRSLAYFDAGDPALVGARFDFGGIYRRQRV